jgi:hypothetical protein
LSQNSLSLLLLLLLLLSLYIASKWQVDGSFQISQNSIKLEDLIMGQPNKRITSLKDHGRRAQRNKYPDIANFHGIHTFVIFS